MTISVDVRSDEAPTVAARLDRLPATRSIWILIGLISFGAFFEIYDLQLSAPLGLGLQTAGIFRRGSAGLFGLSDQASFLACTFAGLYTGTLGFSTIADRFGRRMIFTIALLWYAIATLVMAFQNSAIEIDIWRFISSMGIGLEMVAIDCYLAELTPKKQRGRAFALCTAVQNVAAPVVAILAWRLIPGEHLGMAGWRWLALGPAVGALLIWFVRRALPESPRWLETQGRFAQASDIVTTIEQKVLRESGKPLPAVEPLAVPSGEASRQPLSLWKPPYRRRTIAFILFHVFQVIGYFGVGNWLPTLLVSQGITIGKSLGYTAIVALVAPIAPLVFSLFSDRVERKWLVVVGCLLVAGFGLMMARMTQNSNFLIFTMIGIGVAIGNSLMSLSYHTYQSEVFPTQKRAQAIGFVYSFSRFSAIFSGYLIAAVLDRAGSTGVFTLIAASMLVASLSIGLLGPRTRGLSLEQI
jgi:putative MFS transporter